VRQTLRRSEILRGKESLRSVFSSGKKSGGKFVKSYSLRVAPREDLPSVRTAFVVPGKVKRAVDRNRLKRLMRESFRRRKELLFRHCEEFSVALDLVFLCLPPAKGARLPSFLQIDTDITSLLEKIIRTVPANTPSGSELIA